MEYYKCGWCIGLLLLFRLVLIHGQQQFLNDEEEDEEFAPVVTHRCERGQMVVEVATRQPFRGIVHPRDFRSGPCVAQGRGGRSTTLTLPLAADREDPRFCGLTPRKAGGDVTVALAVRVHPTLELSEDKYFFLTCGKAGFKNARNETSRVTLNFFHDNKKVQELIYNQEYELRAAMTKPDDIHKLKVRSCLSFAPNNTEVQLIDSNGCPLTNFLSSFSYNESSHSASASLSSIFRFPDSNRVSVQCDVVLCRGGPCEQQCRGRSSEPRALPRGGSGDDGQLMASTSVYVLEPGDPILMESLETCTEWRFPWLIGLCICLAILLLVMLIVNIFLCSSLTCTCTKTEVVDKEPSEMDDYDPYRVGWVSGGGSHYGSRSSLHKPWGGGSTLNSTARSDASDHYAIVHSRPGSRYSQQELHKPHYTNHRI